jgi:hypothetical protein
MSQADPAHNTKSRNILTSEITSEIQQMGQVIIETITGHIQRMDITRIW